MMCNESINKKLDNIYIDNIERTAISIHNENERLKQENKQLKEEMSALKTYQNLNAKL